MDKNFNMTLFTILVTVLSHVDALFTKFGKDIRGQFGSGEIGITLIIIMFLFVLIIAIFQDREERNKYLNKKNIITLTVGFIINLPIAIICINNQHLH